MATKNLSLALVTLLAAALACSLPADLPPVQIVVAAGETGAPEASVAPGITDPAPAASATTTPTSTASPTPTMTLTPTPSVPMVTVSQATNCRTGPGIVYDLVGGVDVGEQAVVVGKYTAGGYWIINNLDAPGTCWLWGQYASVSGNTDGLPEYPVPATPTPAPPPAPANYQAIRQCIPMGPGKYNMIVTLKWDDVSDLETGYRVYINNGLLATLDANKTQTAHVLVVFTGVPFKYSIEAFNSTGASARKGKTVHCP